MFVSVTRHRGKLAGVLVLSFVWGLVACGSGSSNSESGSPVAPAVDIADAEELNGSIDNVTISSPPIVDFSLSDGNGSPVTGLPASSVSFKIAKLVPGTDGNTSAWQSYINQIEYPGVGPGTEPKVQATTENGSAGTLVDNDDGSYTYTFALDVTDVDDPLPVSYVPTLTHRVSLEVRGFAALRNPVYDFRPSDNATTGLFSREIAKTGTCNACHGNLSLHGGARFEMQDCVTCHNPGSADANSGNTVDMAVMTHKIHHGENLPSVGMGTDYCIYGFNDTPHCYGDVVLSQDIRNCVICHDGDDTETPEAANWYTKPTAEACGACHDDVNFITGENHGPTIPTDNSQCVTCHASDPNSVIEVRRAHRIPEVEGAAAYSFNILDIAFAGVGTAPDVRFSVTDPTNGDAPYDLANDAELRASPLRFYLAWNTVDYSNAGAGTSNAQPQSTDVYSGGVLQATDNMDFTYTLTLGTVDATATGSGVVTFEGQVVSASGNLPVTTAFRYFAITDVNPVARRSSVDIERCNDCHGLTAFHGTRNNSIESCQVCHLADAARGGSPSRGPMDMKHFLHRKHAVDDIRYPQRTSNCKACHTNDGFYPVSAFSGVLATSTNRGTVTTDPTDNNRMTPNSAACGVCHSTSGSHFDRHGGSLDACQEADGTLRVRVDFCGPGGNKTGALLEERCANCHGAGRFSDTALVHSLD